MLDRTFLDWPFLDARHRALGRELEAWCPAATSGLPADVDAAKLELVERLADGDWLRWLVPAGQGGMCDGPEVAKGRAIAAFAISDDHAGSDMAAMQTTAVRDGGDWVLDGRKTWISNAGIAHFSDARDRRLGAA